MTSSSSLRDVPIKSLRCGMILDAWRWDEVALILPGVDGDNEQLTKRDIVLHSRAGGLEIITDVHPAYVPLYYVLLFPYDGILH